MNALRTPFEHLLVALWMTGHFIHSFIHRQPRQHHNCQSFNDEELEIRFVVGAFLQDFLKFALNSRSHQPVESRPAALRDRYAHQAVGEAIRRDLPAPHIGP